MDYSAEVTIDLPLHEVVRLFDNTENTYWWQPGLKDIKRIIGEDRAEGATYQMVYEGRKNDLVVEETILTSRLPGEYTTESRSPGVVNTVRNTFVSSGEGTTRWQTVSHFRFRGMMRWMSPFMKQAFKSNTLLTMDRFKMYAENENRSSEQEKS